jgi:protein O-GlcNAc transferase
MLIFGRREAAASLQPAGSSCRVDRVSSQQYVYLFVMNRKQRRAAKSQGKAESGRGIVAAGSSAQIAEMFAVALSHHEAGRLVEAERLYRQICSLDPRHVDSLHLLGILAGQVGRNDVAIDLIGRALALKPHFAEAHFNLGNILARENRLDQAAAHYKRVIALRPDFVEAHNSLGTVLSDLGNAGEALACFERALSLKPDCAEAYYNQGIVLSKASRLDDAVRQYERALALKPDYHEAWYNLGNILKKQARLDGAVTHYRRALALRPHFVEGHNGLGAVFLIQGRGTEALACFEKALALKPDYVDALYNRGNALRDLGRFAEALASYEAALTVDPGHVEALNNRGVALHELKRFADALQSYDNAIVLRPDHVEVLYNRGNAFRDLDRLAEALASYDAALAIKPDYAEASNNRGIVLHELKRFDEALASYDKAIVLKPDYPEAFNNRGVTLQELERFEAALASYDDAIALKPDYPEAFDNRGHLLNGEGKWEEALSNFERALALKPDYVRARFDLCMAQLPVLYRDESEIDSRRAAYRRSLENLCNDIYRAGMPPDLVSSIWSSLPFYLAYQGYNDRDLQSLYGSLVCRIMAERYPPAALAPPPRSGESVRLGIVSGFFRQHSNWKIPIKGWLSQIDRSRFRVFGYHTGVVEDVATRQAADLCDRFVQGPLSIERWRNVILSDAPHVLIYPEVGMNTVTAQLAAQRLAPIQCNSWGHPDTSGFPTLDYYISSELMEPPDAQSHYTERLVCLPNLSVYYEPPDPPASSLHRTDLGLSSTATVYWCGQSLYKYLPNFDQVFPRIAQQAGDCQFAFIRYWQGTHLNELFFERLERAFGAFGLKAADHCVLLPRLDPSRFVAAVGQCDIVLDSIGWSGCNSTLEGLLYDLPIVTMAGPLMRGRHTTAILQMMGVDETITETIEDYVSTAVRLALDRPWRTAVKNKISENKTRIYRDTACVSALQEFLDRVARSRSGAAGTLE